MCRDIVPLGQVRSSFNYNVERKRVLNFVNIVTDDDNVKQDLSIDVYGRKEKADEEEAQAAADPKKQEEVTSPVCAGQLCTCCTTFALLTIFFIKCPSRNRCPSQQPLILLHDMRFLVRPYY